MLRRTMFGVKRFFPPSSTSGTASSGENRFPLEHFLLRLGRGFWPCLGGFPCTRKRVSIRTFSGSLGANSSELPSIRQRYNNGRLVKVFILLLQNGRSRLVRKVFRAVKLHQGATLPIIWTKEELIEHSSRTLVLVIF
jgi:hypothetical protein